MSRTVMWISLVFLFVSSLGHSEKGPVFSEREFLTALRATLKGSPLTGTQKAKHVLNRMSFGGNPLSDKQPE